VKCAVLWSPSMADLIIKIRVLNFTCLYFCAVIPSTEFHLALQEGDVQHGTIVGVISTCFFLFSNVVLSGYQVLPSVCTSAMQMSVCKALPLTCTLPIQWVTE